MRALVVIVSVAVVASCSRPPESAPTSPSPVNAQPMAAPPSNGNPFHADWSCGAAAVREGAADSSPWVIALPGCATAAMGMASLDSGSAAVFSPGPTNYRATVNGTNVRLQWDQAAGTFGFQIEAGSSPGLANLAVLRIAQATAGTVTFDVANVPPGRYFSRVRSAPTNFADLSVGSNEIEVIVGSSCSAAPAAPSGFVASISGANVVLNWNAPAGQPVSSYLLEVGSAAGLSNLLVFDTGNAATSLAATAAPATYFARLRSRNACGTSAATPDLQVIVGGGSQPPPPSACSVSLSPPSQSVPTAGASFDLQVTTASNCAWQATVDSPWLSFGSAPSGQGNGVVRVNAAANAGAGRNGRVSVTTSTSSAATDVAQNGTTIACTYSVSPTSFNVIAAGGNVIANVTAPAGCTWTSASNSGFITIGSGSSGNGNGSVTLQVAANTGAARNGSARVSWTGGGQDLNVSQSAAPPAAPPTASFAASPDPCLLTGTGLSCTFNASASTAGSGTITAYLWQYLSTNLELTGATHSPTEFTQCGIGPNQQVAVPVTLRVRNSANVVSSPFQATVTLRRQGACGF